MKQNITIEQLSELSEKAKEKLREWAKNKKNMPWSVKDYTLPLLSIGQMIEFLDEAPEREDGYGEWEWFVEAELVSPELLCDALWNACKEVLEQEEKR